MKKVMIVDDSEIMRRNIKAIIASANKYEIIGDARNGAEALEKFEKLRPDIVTMDITMPIMDGIECSKNILNKFPDANIIIVSALDQKSLVFTALEIGVKQYVMKPVTPKTLLKALSDIEEDSEDKLGVKQSDIVKFETTLSDAEKSNNHFIIEKDAKGHIILNIKKAPDLKMIEEIMNDAIKISSSINRNHKVIFNFENIFISDDSVVDRIFDIFKKMADSKVNFITVSTNVSFLQMLVIKEYEMNTKVIFKSDILDAIKD